MSNHSVHILCGDCLARDMRKPGRYICKAGEWEPAEHAQCCYCGINPDALRPQAAPRQPTKFRDRSDVGWEGFGAQDDEK